MTKRFDIKFGIAGHWAAQEGAEVETIDEAMLIGYERADDKLRAWAGLHGLPDPLSPNYASEAAELIWVEAVEVK